MGSPVVLRHPRPRLVCMSAVCLLAGAIQLVKSVNGSACNRCVRVSGPAARPRPVPALGPISPLIVFSAIETQILCKSPRRLEAALGSWSEPICMRRLHATRVATHNNRQSRCCTAVERAAGRANEGKGEIEKLRGPSSGVRRPSVCSNCAHTRPSLSLAI